MEWCYERRKMITCLRTQRSLEMNNYLVSFLFSCLDQPQESRPLEMTIRAVDPAALAVFN